MSAFALKIIACISMFMDHIGYIIFDTSSFFNYIGRIAFPIFAFQISQGYVHTKNIQRYIIRLSIFAIISQIPFMLFHSIIAEEFAINVIFTLIFGLISIIFYDKTNKLLGILVAVSLGIIAQICHFDYGLYGVIIILLFYIFGNSKTALCISFGITTIIYYAYRILTLAEYKQKYLPIAFEAYMPLCISTLLSSVFICLYNNKKGHDFKYLLYLFYPLHLLLIYVLYLIGF